MKITKYIILPAVIIITLIFTVTNSEGLNYWLTWGGNRAAWIYSDSGYIYPSLPIRMKSGDSLKYNGVTVTSGTGGGGIAASDNITFSGYNTFTNGVTFSDSIRANGYSIIDDANILTSLRVNGDVLTNLEFNKGSSTSIGTISTDSLAFITANTKRIVIDKNGYTVFTDTVQMLDRVYISGNLNVASNIYTTGNILADSIAGIGRFITDVDAITLKGQDTTHFARLDTLTTERVKSKTEFSDIVTFFLSPTIASIYQNASRTIQYFFPNSASDTLATISQTQTITNKTITGSTNAITGIKSGLIVVDPLVLTPVNDATNYYCGGFNNLAPTGTAGNQRLYFPTACTIKAVYVATYIIGSATSETVTAYIRKNNTTDSTIGTVAWSNASGYNNLSNYNMGVVLAQGDYIEFKFLTPTWATNPTSAYIVITFYFE